MNEEDREVIQAEQDAMRHSGAWNADDSFFKRYSQLTSEQREALHHEAAAVGGPVQEFPGAGHDFGGAHAVSDFTQQEEPRDYHIHPGDLSDDSGKEYPHSGDTTRVQSRYPSDEARQQMPDPHFPSVVEARDFTVHPAESTASSDSSSMSSELSYATETVSPFHKGHTSSRLYSVATLNCNQSEPHEGALDRIETARTVHEGTVGGRRATGIPSRRRSTIFSYINNEDEDIPLMGAGKAMPPMLPAQEEYVVEFNGFDDPRHAQNWPMKKRILISLILVYDALAATIGSSIWSSAIVQVTTTYHVGLEVGTLGISLFVLGYAFGPIIWAPMSELMGRRPPLIIGCLGFAIFATAVATAKDIQTIMICRFFDGLFGSCPLAVVAAAFADMYDNSTRGLAIAAFAVAVFMGPFLAPFIGGFIADSYLGWRWTQYLSAIMGYSSLILLVLFFPETYGPTILVHKAAEMRRKTKNWGIHAKQEEIEVDFKELIVKNVSRPFRILFTEPIVFLLTLYMSFVYGLLYLFLTAYALVFEGKYGFNQGQSGLTYFGMVVGECIAFVIMVFLNPSYVRKLKDNNNIPVPEWRLPIAVLGGLTFTGGLFWFGWTGYKGYAIPWIVPTLSGLLTGFGIFAIFLSLLNYLVDSYLMFAASAIAANTFLRSVMAAAFPLFADYMFVGMGIQWASTLVGCIAAAMIPLPVIFYLYGRKIREKSKMAPSPDIAQDKRRDEEAKLGNLTGGGGMGMSRRSTRLQQPMVVGPVHTCENCGHKPVPMGGSRRQSEMMRRKRQSLIRASEKVE